MDSDDIPLDNPRAESGLCWSCQKVLPATGQPVSLGPDILPPVCMTCWDKMPVADRLRLGIEFADRADKPTPPVFGSRRGDYRGN